MVFKNFQRALYLTKNAIKKFNEEKIIKALGDFHFKTKLVADANGNVHLGRRQCQSRGKFIHGEIHGTRT